MYERILLPTDENESMAKVFEHAADIASRRDAVVHVLYVVDDRAFLTLDDDMQDDVLEQLHAEGDTATTDAADYFADAGVEVETATRRGDPAEQILDYVGEADIDLVVMGTRRNNYERSMLGSVSRKVVPESDVPVLTVNIADEA